MSQYIENAAKAIVTGDNVEFMKELKNAMYEELGNNEDYLSLTDELDRYSIEQQPASSDEE